MFLLKTLVNYIIVFIFETIPSTWHGCRLIKLWQTIQDNMHDRLQSNQQLFSCRNRNLETFGKFQPDSLVNYWDVNPITIHSIAQENMLFSPSPHWITSYTQIHNYDLVNEVITWEYLEHTKRLIISWNLYRHSLIFHDFLGYRKNFGGKVSSIKRKLKLHLKCYVWESVEKVSVCAYVFTYDFHKSHWKDLRVVQGFLLPLLLLHPKRRFPLHFLLLCHFDPGKIYIQKPKTKSSIK